MSLDPNLPPPLTPPMTNILQSPKIKKRPQSIRAQAVTAHFASAKCQMRRLNSKTATTQEGQLNSFWTYTRTCTQLVQQVKQLIMCSKDPKKLTSALNLFTTCSPAVPGTVRELSGVLKTLIMKVKEGWNPQGLQELSENCCSVWLRHPPPLAPAIANMLQSPKNQKRPQSIYSQMVMRRFAPAKCQIRQQYAGRRGGHGRFDIAGNVVI